MSSWIVLTFLYGMCKGFFDCAKKKASQKNSTHEVLGFFTLFSFLLAAMSCKNVLDISYTSLLIIFFKSSICVIAWILSLNVMRKISVSLYGVTNVSRVLFSILLGVLIFNEQLTFLKFIGIIIVIIGLICMNIISTDTKNKKKSFKYILILLIACFLNSIASIIDKGIMSYVTPSQLQFWFLLFSTIIYWILIFIKKEKINFKSIKNNYWILLASIFLVFGDKLLFIANNIPESKVTIMTVIKQISTIEIIILGKLLFKEKNILKKLLCSILVILGIVLTII